MPNLPAGPALVLRPEERQRLILHLTLLLISICAVTGAAVSELAVQQLRKDTEPYHTSILSGEEWVLELLTGHPERIRNELGMHAQVFNELISLLRSYGHSNSRSVSLEEQLAIFLYNCVTGLPVKHVLNWGALNLIVHFHSYFRKMVIIFSAPPFYKTFVIPPGIDTVSSKLRSNPKFWPYFKDAIGAIDSSHIPIAPPAQLAPAFRNRKGQLSQNCLFTCDFDLRFTYTLTGWEGSASDVRVYDDTFSCDLNIPEGKYLLADLSYPSNPSLLVPYRGVRYHLAEWGQANARPANPRELFNLRHASARNVIERAFGVLKNRFRILLLPAPYSLEIQTRIPAALCAVHNFIRFHEHNEEAIPDDNPDDGSGHMHDDSDSENDSEENGDTELRDKIADRMWGDYLDLRRARGLDEE